ncbi:TorD/DmsD family molecular chaperone [Campylobacter bilis]|uniref:TorD/DmsD family molecular chaperone n=1 Tax=Campylobacter bilis TaxID=2691918 RepID=UPI00130EEB04|nr:molecular chaperone TorD family protein [Campylobacter bilis]
MDLEKLRLARSLYYQCLGELFIFSFSKKRLSKLQEYLKTMQECLFDESLKLNFNILLKHLEGENSIEMFFKEYDLLFLGLKNNIAMTFSYIEEGFENSTPLLCVRQILAKSKIRANEKFFKEGEDNVGFCLLLMSEFLRQGEEDLAKELFEKVINKNIEEFLGDILNHENANLYKEVAKIAMAFMQFERICFNTEKSIKTNSKKVQNDLSRSEFLRREANKQRRTLEKSQRIS